MAFHLNGVIIYKYFTNQKLAFPRVPRRPRIKMSQTKMPVREKKRVAWPAICKYELIVAYIII